MRLARQLGLLETIYVEGTESVNSMSSSSDAPQQRPQIAVQQFDYLMIIDFEATCWENQAPPRWRESEIIEFPAVLLNLKTGKIEAEFQKYVMPIESPRLSEFCIQLTGITQDKVDNGIPLQTAIMIFQEWLRKEIKAHNLVLPKMSKDNKLGNCAFVTWSDWDLGCCLQKECRRKRIRKPPYFNQWIDLRLVFRQWYNYRPLNFNDALAHVGLIFEGREHSGLDDSRNIARLAYKMVRDGATLAITKDLTPFELNSNFII